MERLSLASVNEEISDEGSESSYLTSSNELSGEEEESPTSVVY
jgi:hypothetical protein